MSPATAWRGDPALGVAPRLQSVMVAASGRNPSRSAPSADRFRPLASRGSAPTVWRHDPGPRVAPRLQSVTVAASGRSRSHPGRARDPIRPSGAVRRRPSRSARRPSHRANGICRPRRVRAADSARSRQVRFVATAWRHGAATGVGAAPPGGRLQRPRARAGENGEARAVRAAGIARSRNDDAQPVPARTPARTHPQHPHPPTKPAPAPTRAPHPTAIRTPAPPRQ